MKHMLDLITVLACAVGLAGCIAFGAVYHVRSGGAWWRNRGLEGEIGKILMAMNVALASILLLIATVRLFGDWPGRRPIVLALVVAYVLKPWWWLRVVWHAHSRQDSVRPTSGE